MGGCCSADTKQRRVDASQRTTTDVRNPAVPPGTRNRSLPSSPLQQTEQRTSTLSPAVAAVVEEARQEAAQYHAAAGDSVGGEGSPLAKKASATETLTIAARADSSDPRSPKRETSLQSLDLNMARPVTWVPAVEHLVAAFSEREGALRTTIEDEERRCRYDVRHDERRLYARMIVIPGPADEVDKKSVSVVPLCAQEGPVADVRPIALPSQDLDEPAALPTSQPSSPLRNPSASVPADKRSALWNRLSKPRKRVTSTAGKDYNPSVQGPPPSVQRLAAMDARSRVLEEIRMVRAAVATPRLRTHGFHGGGFGLNPPPVGTSSFLDVTPRLSYPAVPSNARIETMHAVAIASHMHLRSPPNHSAHQHPSRSGEASRSGSCSPGPRSRSVPLHEAANFTRSASVCSRGCVSLHGGEKLDTGSFRRSHSVGSSWARDTSARWNFFDNQLGAAGSGRMSLSSWAVRRRKNALSRGDAADGDEPPGPGSYDPPVALRNIRRS